MIVVADTSPIDYLVLLDQVNLLHSLYGRIVIPHAVQDELLDRDAPQLVRAWAKNPPNWLEILSPSTLAKRLAPNLDPGESEAIALAEELHADWVLIDEMDGRDEAQRRGLKTIGTLGILLEGHNRQLLDLQVTLQHLRSLGFYVSDSLIKQLLNHI